MKKILILFIAIITSGSADAQALKKYGKEVVEQALKLVGKESIESSDIIIKRVFKDDIAENILDRYDDDILEKLAKEVSENSELKGLLTSNNSAFKTWLLLGNTKASKNIEVIKYFSNIMDDLGEQGLKNKYVFQQSGDILIIKSKKGRQMASINNDIITAKPWKGNKDLNPLLNELQLIPNSTFKINGQYYKTLENGQYKEISGVLTHLPKNKPARSIKIQAQSKKVKGGIPVIENGRIVRTQSGNPVYKDDGGHIVANVFGGGSEMYNLIPMSSKINRQGGAWAQMERRWEKAIREGEKVDYKITPIYKGSSQRPDKLYVTYEIEGKRVTELFDNNVF